MNFSYKIPKDIRDIGLTPLLFEEFSGRLMKEDGYHEIIITDKKIIFSGSNLGMEIYINYFLQLSLNNFPEGFHIHDPCDPTEDFSSKELMLYKNEPNLDLQKNNIFIEDNYFRFIMPPVQLENLINIKKKLLKDRYKKEIVVDTSDNYPSPGISASGMSFYKLGKALYLFNRLTDINSFYIFDDLEFLKY